ncbi:GDSL esterase/lipase At2g04570-like [Musa acuminata AAA Group]|uniref:GDSL esterase/lipase At2g04570-like n=1 Tax=Musa acuminata AAA Group TaxID=214697 RepID=UPI0031D270D4
MVLSLLLFLLLFPSLAAPSRIPAIIVFGDSTVDAGNNNYVRTIARANFPPYGRDFPGGRATGRFCNGRLATDFVSESLGLPPTVPAYLDPAYSIKDFATGVCFASAATGLDTATSDVLSVIPLWQEMEYFKEYKKRLTHYVGRKKAMHIIHEAVYIVSVGTNDFIENYYSPTSSRSKQFTVEEYEDFLIGLAARFLTKLHRQGARKISFTGLSPFGCLPSERATNFLGHGECMEQYNKVAIDFNMKLQALIERLCASSPGLKLRFTPTYDLFLHVVQNPSSYGFENAIRGCCGTGRMEMGYFCNEWSHFTCEDPNKFVFWDSVHPSESLNRIFANQTLRTSLAEFL